MRTPTAFITGIAGFAGSFLAEELLAAGFKVSGALYKKESTRQGLPYIFLVRELAQKCSSLEEAKEYMRTARRTMGNNILISQADPAAATVAEYTARRIAFVCNLFVACAFDLARAALDRPFDFFMRHAVVARLLNSQTQRKVLKRLERGLFTDFPHFNAFPTILPHRHGATSPELSG